eukprot:2580235-Rhodomonas_salina.1
MCGTELAYAALGCPVLTQRMLRPDTALSTPRKHDMVSSYALCGTVGAYAAMNSGTKPYGIDQRYAAISLREV